MIEHNRRGERHNEFDEGNNRHHDGRFSATLALFGIPTAIEIHLHRRAKKKNQQEAERVARESLKKYGNHFEVPRKDR